MVRKLVCVACSIMLVALFGTVSARAQDGTPHTHVVQPGENLFRIALHYQIGVDALMRANGLQDANLVVTGQTLIIPASGTVAPAPAATASGSVTHTVAIGDTLLTIARRYGVSADAIMQANALIDPSLLVTGQVLIIPGASGTVDLGIIGPKPVIPPITPEVPDDLGIIDTHGATSAPPAGGSGAPAETAAPPPSPVAAADTADSAADADDVADAADDAAEAADHDTDANPEVVPAAAPAAPAPMSDADSGTDPAPDVTAPDLGILTPDDDAAPRPDTNPDAVPPADESVAAPDLGIINPDAAAWQLLPGILTTGGPRVRAIYVQGLALGNNPHAFSKIGDCNSEPPFFLAKFDLGDYDLGPYAYLQPVVDHFAGSFARESMTAWTGNHAWALFDPTWSNPAFCQPGETPLACEFRVNRPSLVLIRLGTNEARSPQLFEASLRRIIEFSIERGVIPVLGTKADRIEGSDAINEIIRALADEYEVPLWDFGRVADTLPARGLQEDGFHMTYVPLNYATSAALQSGHSVHNLLALMALNTVWHNAMY